MSRCGMISTTTIIIFLAYSQNCTQFMAAPGRSRLESPSWRRTASLLALLCSVLICLQSSAQQGPRVFVGAAEAAAADDGELLTRHQQQGGGKQLLSSGDLEPIVMDGLDPSDQKGVGEPETLIGSGSSFAAALHSVRTPAWLLIPHPSARALAAVVPRRGRAPYFVM